jgi:hypothetical protein
MSECPYEETIIDETSDSEVANDKYIAWHQGYEAHKNDIGLYVTELKTQLEDEIKKTRQLQVDLIVKYYEHMTKLTTTEKPQEAE